MRVILCVAGFIVAMLATPNAFAATVAFRDLTPQQTAALDASQERLTAFDHALQMLDQRYARNRISLSDYRYQERDLLGFIANEADFQNAILHKDRPDPFMLSSDQSEKISQGCAYAAEFLAKGGLAFLQVLNR